MSASRDRHPNLIRASSLLRGLCLAVGLAAGPGATNDRTATPETPLPSPDQVLERYFEALGGRTVLAQVRTAVVQGSARESGELRLVDVGFKAPHRFRWTAVRASATERLACDRLGAWWCQDSAGTRELQDDPAVALWRGRIFGLNVPGILAWKDQAARLEVVGKEPTAGSVCYALRAVLTNASSLVLLFDADSGLLRRAGKTEFSDYREVDGVKVPFLLREPDGLTLTVKTVEFNVPVGDASFERPGAKPAPAAGESGAWTNEYQSLRSPAGTLAIVRHPPPADFARGRLTSLPVYDPASRDSFQVDLRSLDATGLDLRDRLADLLHAAFDARTRWPERLPAGFDRARIEELGRNPGLGVRELHRRGITGRGVGLAIIDQPLLVEHVEYADRLRLYEEIHVPSNSPAQMHGPAVASIAVGRTVGVAPAADLYYIAAIHVTPRDGGAYHPDFAWFARAIDRLVEVNATLPAGKKIRVISMSVGWTPGEPGADLADQAVARAKQAGVFVICTAIERIHRLAFHGLGRDPLLDPDVPASFGLGSWWAQDFLNGSFRFPPGRRLLVPMDARTTAAPNGTDEYVFYAQAGWSWAVPYLAGLYALACQVRPDLTPEIFWSEAMRTGNTIKISRGGGTFELGNIANPVKLIGALR